MKKKDLITLVMGAAGGLLFALGMCMALLPEWGVVAPGIAVGAAGMLILLAMVLIRRRMDGKPAISNRRRTVGITLLGVSGAVILGVGMCMSMVWSMMIPGIVVGIVGIAALLGLIPAVKGLKG